MSRSAHLSRDSDGDALGCSIFLNADELEELGIDTKEASEVQYGVSDGQLRVQDGDYE